MLTNNKHDLAEILFPSHQTQKYKETSAKQGIDDAEFVVEVVLCFIVSVISDAIVHVFC